MVCALFFPRLHCSVWEVIPAWREEGAPDGNEHSLLAFCHAVLAPHSVLSLSEEWASQKKEVFRHTVHERRSKRGIQVWTQAVIVPVVDKPPFCCLDANSVLEGHRLVFLASNCKPVSLPHQSVKHYTQTMPVMNTWLSIPAKSPHRISFPLMTQRNTLWLFITWSFLPKQETAGSFPLHFLWPAFRNGGAWPVSTGAWCLCCLYTSIDMGTGWVHKLCMGLEAGWCGFQSLNHDLWSLCLCFAVA